MNSCAKTLSIAAGRKTAALYVGIQTLTLGWRSTVRVESLGAALNLYSR